MLSPDPASAPLPLGITVQRVRWPVWLGIALILMAPLLLLGLYLYTRGTISVMSFYTELGGLALGTLPACGMGFYLQRWITRRRSPDKPLIEGILLLTVGASLMLGSLGTCISALRVYQAEGASGLAIRDATANLTNPQLKQWAIQFEQQHEAIYTRLNTKIEATGSEAVEAKLSDFFASANAARDGAKRARTAAIAYHNAATDVRKLLTESGQRLQQLGLSPTLLAKQQQALANEVAPARLALATFIDARGDTLEARGALLGLVATMIDQGDFRWTGSRVEIKSEAGSTTYDAQFQALLAKQKELDRLHSLLPEGVKTPPKR